MGQFTGKVVLITGGTTGIGQALAAAFAAEKARVIITGRDETRGQQALVTLQACGIEVHYVPGDAAKEEDNARWVDYALRHFGRLDVAVNNAGIEGSPAPVTEVTAADCDAVFAVNVKGLLLGMKHQIGALRTNGGGAIVNVSSMVGSVAVPGAAVYVASKHAVEGVTRAAALEEAKHQIRVNAVAPGAVDTQMLQRFTGGKAASQAGLAAAHPLGRLAQPQEIASAVLYLASPGACFTTGTILAVDGGYTAQ